VKGLVLENRRITILEGDIVLGTSFGSFQSSLNYSKNRCHIAAEFITHLLSEGQEGNHVSFCQYLQERLDEAWL
jgi:hypothetical protein